VAARLDGVGWLNRFARQPLALEAVEETLIAVFADQLGVTLQESSPTPREAALAAELCRCFYADPKWTVQGPGVKSAASRELPA
jgi:lipoate-protein ligase A